MGIRKIKGEEKFVFETEEERDVLEMARNYFGESSSLLIDGLGYKIKKRCAPARFNFMKRGEYSNGWHCCIPVEQWEKIQDYASSYKKRIAYIELPLAVKS